MRKIIIISILIYLLVGHTQTAVLCGQSKEIILRPFLHFNKSEEKSIKDLHSSISNGNVIALTKENFLYFQDHRTLWEYLLSLKALHPSFLTIKVLGTRKLTEEDKEEVVRTVESDIQKAVQRILLTINSISDEKQKKQELQIIEKIKKQRPKKVEELNPVEEYKMVVISIKNPDIKPRLRIAIVSGLDGNEVGGTETTIALIEEYMKGTSESLRDVEFLIIPQANPTGAFFQSRYSIDGEDRGNLNTMFKEDIEHYPFEVQIIRKWLKDNHSEQKIDWAIDIHSEIRQSYIVLPDLNDYPHLDAITDRAINLIMARWQKNVAGISAPTKEAWKFGDENVNSKIKWKPSGMFVAYAARLGIPSLLLELPERGRRDNMQERIEIGMATILSVVEVLKEMYNDLNIKRSLESEKSI